VAALKPTGQACGQNEECQSGICGGTCLASCMNEVHCSGAGMTCFPTGDLGAGILMGACGADFGTLNGQTCESPPGSFNYDGAACSSGHCDLMSPFGLYNCAPLCRGEGDCGVGQECNMVILAPGSNPQSVPFDAQAQLPTHDAITACYSVTGGTGNLPLGSVCGAKSQCKSNKCLALVPGDNTQYCTGFCTHDEECPAGMACKPELINGVSDWLAGPYSLQANPTAYSLVRICKLQ
jgi:hypothetical protein